MLVTSFCLRKTCFRSLVLLVQGHLIVKFYLWLGSQHSLVRIGFESGCLNRVVCILNDILIQTLDNPGQMKHFFPPALMLIFNVIF